MILPPSFGVLTSIFTMMNHNSFGYINPVFKILLTFGVGLAICALL